LVHTNKKEVDMKNKFYIKRKNYRGFLLSTIPIPVLCTIVIITSLFSAQYGLIIVATALLAIPIVGYFTTRSKGNLDKFLLDENGIKIIRGIKKEIAYFPWENLNKLVKTNVSGTVSLQLRLTDEKGNKIKIHTDNLEKFRKVRKEVQGK